VRITTCRQYWRHVVLPPRKSERIRKDSIIEFQPEKLPRKNRKTEKLQKNRKTAAFGIMFHGKRLRFLTEKRQTNSRDLACVSVAFGLTASYLLLVLKFQLLPKIWKKFNVFAE
jgi:hypothetical protein